MAEPHPVNRLWQREEPRHGTSRETQEERRGHRRDAKRREERQRLRAVVAVIFFAALTLTFAALTSSRSIDFDRGMTGVLVCGAFPVASIALLPWVRGKRTPEQGPSPTMWVFLLLGAAMWVAAPLVLLASGHSWTDHVFEGDGRRNPPIWALAAITWGTCVAMLFALAAQFYKRARQRAKQPEEQR